jgi:WD40 repeat protein
MTFNGFISYSHAADGRLAPAVQRGLHRLAKPWHRRRALWIFRDQTGLSVTPALWSSIQTALDRSDYFVLLSSPEAADSPWVNREIDHWVATKSADHILPVVTDGEWRWDQELGDFAEDSTAVPQALRGVFAEEPLYLDLRWARDDPHLSLRHSRFRDAIAQLAAPMHGIDKDDLEGEDVRQHRRVARLRWAAVTALLFLSLAAVVTGALAMRNAAQATASAAETQRQQQLVAEQRESAAQFAAEAQRQERLARENEAHATQAGAEAVRQEGLVRQQKALVGKTSAEVKLQVANADRAATRARQNERLAKQQSALAAESAREMRRQVQRTKDEEKIAGQQTSLAAQAAADAQIQQDKATAAGKDAARQKANADQQQRIAIGRRLINQAGETIGDDPQYALRLGVAAQRINPDAETRRAVTGMVTSTRFAGAIDGVSKPAYGPNGLLASVTGDGAVALWSTANQGIPVQLATIGKSDSAASVYLALSSDGRRLAVSQDGAVSLWNVADPSRPVRTGTLPTDPSRSYDRLWFSPDGRTLVTSGGAVGSYATLWDVSDPAHPAILSALTSSSGGSASLLTFSGDGRTLVVYHHWVDVWDVTDLRNPVRRSGLGAGSGGIDTGTAIPVPPGSTGGSGPSYETHTALALSAGTPALLALDTTGGDVQLYDLTDTAKPVLRGLLTAPTTSSVVVDFSTDGRLLAAGYGRGTAIVWDVTKNSSSFEPKGSLSIGPSELVRLPVGKVVNAVELSPDGKTLATADTTSTVTLWSVEGFGVPQRLAEGATGGSAPGPTVDVGDNLLFSSDGRTVVAEDYDGSMNVMDLTDPAHPVTLSTIDTGLQFQTARAFSPDGRTLIFDGLRGGPPGERDVQVWDLTDRSHPTRIATLADADVRPGGIVFNSDGRTLALSGAKSVSLWDLTNRAAPAKLSTLSGVGAVLMAFSSDGNTLSMVDSGRAVQLWDVTDRIRPRRLSALPPVNPPAQVTSANLIIELAFSKDGQTLAVGSGPTVNLWDIAERTKPARIATIDLDPETNTRAMAFDKSGNILTINGLGRWDLTALNGLRPDPSKVGCTIAGRGLNQEEWALLVPELPYQSTCPG